MNIDMKMIAKQAATAVSELLEKTELHAGDIFVVGCSSSEIVGGNIGHDSSLEAAKAVFSGIYPILHERGIYLAAQCCEHLNRALIVEKACTEKYGYEIVSVVPHAHAGGSFATVAHDSFSAPVAVEHIKAHAGLDIGDTLIGMHLRNVAVPQRLTLTCVGEANLVCASTRPKFIGGERAKYN